MHLNLILMICFALHTSVGYWNPIAYGVRTFVSTKTTVGMGNLMENKNYFDYVCARVCECVFANRLKCVVHLHWIYY